MSLIETLNKIDKIKKRLKVLHEQDEEEIHARRSKRGNIRATKDRIWMAYSLSKYGEKYKLPGLE